MAKAICQNENCERGKWELRKHPSDYKGGVSCPDCGSTRVEILYEGGEGQQRQQQRESPKPARSEQQQSGGVPASGGIQFGEAESAGDALAQSVMSVTSDEVDNQEKAKAVGSIGSVVVDGVTRFLQYKDKVEKHQERVASEVDLEKATDKPRCEECGHVFSKIPSNTGRVACPECGMEYDIVK